MGCTDPPSKRAGAPHQRHLDKLPLPLYADVQFHTPMTHRNDVIRYAYSKAEAIPYKHILLDSWWYTKGDAGGLKEWDATTDTFPDGLKAFADKTQWKFQMHNR